MRLARLLSRVTQLNKSLTVARFSGQSRVGEAKRGFPGLLEIATLAGPSGAFLSGIISAELHQLPADIGPIQEKKKSTRLQQHQLRSARGQPQYQRLLASGDRVARPISGHGSYPSQ